MILLTIRGDAAGSGPPFVIVLAGTAKQDVEKHNFTNEERFAVFRAHGEKCYICRRLIDFQSMEVDHVIPEMLLEDPPTLSRALADFGLPPQFNLKLFSNWLPTCRQCNGTKANLLFTPSPLIQLQLQKAIAKAEKVAKMADAQVGSRAISNALGTIQSALAAGSLTPSHALKIRGLASQLTENREPEMENQPLQITPQFGIISESNGVRILQGPYGVGTSPLNPTGDFICVVCGRSGWNGARCIFCGNWDDD